MAQVKKKIKKFFVKRLQSLESVVYLNQTNKPNKQKTKNKE
jgi:hypothetical protein